ncbi:DNA helicase RecQ [Leyella stercorea]|uniref:DNA helicase RecQ n=1 Tax=Leyella stercorea TaxID=363265 RepID=UPI003AF7A7B2
MERPADKIYDVLKRYWGFTEFRPVQERIIRSVMDGRDTLALMPTGGGKSLTYQIPGLAQEGLCIVVTPLIALMKDQVDRLRARHIPAVAIHSGLSPRAIDIALDNCVYGDVKFLYVAPERLATEAFRLRVVRMNVSLVAVDEAHCISQWGYDFRPSYLRIAELREKLPGVPVLALTASATGFVAEDIMRHLKFAEPHILRSSFARPNLSYSVRRTDDKNGQLLRLVQNVPGSGIVYVRTREGTEQVADMLRRQGVTAAAYHGGMGHAERSLRQEEWVAGRTRVMVATNAFGMGIDKPDVRFVIHYDIPKSLEGYYQETGRAGRDGGEGICIAFYAYKDLQKLEKFMEGKPVAEQDIGKQLLQETAAYAETSMCRRKVLLHYFGEEYPKENCGNCDNCLHPKVQRDGQEALLIVLKAIIAVKEAFRQDYIVDFVKGRATDDIVSHHHEQLEEFGAGEDMPVKIWNPVIRQGMIAGYIHKDIESYGLLKMTAAGKRYVKNPTPFTYVEDTDFSETEEEASEATASALDPTLYNMLLDLRKKTARKQNLPAYVIFQDVSLEQMATMYPVTLEELRNIQGIGVGKANRYGKPFCELISQYCKDNEIERPEELFVRTVAKDSMKKVKIIQYLDRRMPLDDIASALGLDFEDLLNDLDAIVYSGTKLNIDYFLEDVMDEDQIDDIYEYFRESDTDDIDTALDELGDYEENEIRLVRIKFLSEQAN